MKKNIPTIYKHHHSLLFTLATLAILFVPAIAFSGSLSAEKLLQIINNIRNDHSLPALQNNLLLEQAAQNKADQLINTNTFSHTLPDGKEFYQFLDEAKYNYVFAGENLAMDFYDEQQLADAFMASQAHRANILKPEYQDVGISIKYGTIEDKYTDLVVILFGTPADKMIATTNPDIDLLQFLSKLKSPIKFALQPHVILILSLFGIITIVSVIAFLRKPIALKLKHK